MEPPANATSNARAKRKKTPFSQKLIDKIFHRMAGGESLRAICKDSAMPSRQTVMRWIAERPELVEPYRLAMEMRADSIADEVLEIADEPLIGTKVKVLPGGIKEETTGDCVDRSRLKVAARQWYLAKLSPKRFGAKIAQEISGPDGGPVQLDVSLPTADDLSEFTRQFILAWTEEAGKPFTVEESRKLAEVLAGLAAGKHPELSPEELGRCFARAEKARGAVRAEQQDEGNEI